MDRLLDRFASFITGSLLTAAARRFNPSFFRCLVNKLNPELDSQLHGLAEICCAVIQRTESDSTTRARPLLEALVTGGYARLSDVNLQVRLEDLAADLCRETAIHRRQELTGITGQMQSTFNDLVRWQTQSPQEPSGTKAANISSNTDA